jgi:hypothetical protein
MLKVFFYKPLKARHLPLLISVILLIAMNSTVFCMRLHPQLSIYLVSYKTSLISQAGNLTTLEISSKVAIHH